uniref:C-type lectin domain-containing protein n=1 Tax=Brugia timori TaxID=42155 RepID=A0A0R3QYH3_9BILA
LISVKNNGNVDNILNLQETRETNFLFNFQFISPVQNYGTSWIADPEGHHYQFHLSEQSWNIAREICLALASDLVVIKSLQQIVSHYPLRNSIMPERTIQIGLVLVDKENSAEKEWKWVDNTPLNATYLLAIYSATKIPI